jgi:hypothetical protein
MKDDVPMLTQAPSLLQPLPVSHVPWSIVGRDFINGLPKSEGKDFIIVVVDRFTKFIHFIPLSYPYLALDVANSFFTHIYTLHGLPTYINLIFTSKFSKELLNLLGIKLNMSYVYHPQTDNQRERVNQCLENYLRSMLLDQPKKWTK